jgi:hemerythrin superfamily protein
MFSKRVVLGNSLTKPLNSFSKRTFASTPVTMGKIYDTIKHDHDELRTQYNNILNAKTDDEKTRWQNQFTWELARHSIGEELVVYPSIEKTLPNGVALAEKERAEHQKVNLQRISQLYS